jgi:hypothetical protein
MAIVLRWFTSQVYILHDVIGNSFKIHDIYLHWPMVYRLNVHSNSVNGLLYSKFSHLMHDLGFII